MRGEVIFFHEAVVAVVIAARVQEGERCGEALCECGRGGDHSRVCAAASGVKQLPEKKGVGHGAVNWWWCVCVVVFVVMVCLLVLVCGIFDGPTRYRR